MSSASGPTPSLDLDTVAEKSIEAALAEEFPTAPKRLSKKAAAKMYHGGPPLSHREQAALDRATPRAGNTEVAVSLNILTDRHSSAAEKIKAATELGNLALDDGNKEAIGEEDSLAALVKLCDKGPTAQAKERAAGTLRNLAVSSWPNKDAIGKAGGIPPLVALASSEVSSEVSVDFAIGALASLALDADNKRLIADAGGIPMLVRHVANGATAAIQTLAAIAIGNLTSNEASNGIAEDGRHSNKLLVNEAGGIGPLVDLAICGTTEQREASVGALWNLAFNDANKKAIADAGGVPPLVDLARAGTPRQKEQAAAALANLTVDPDNRSRVVGAGGIAALVPLMSGGETERQRSFAHACLSNLAVDEMIKAKILVTARSGEETARAQALAEACRNKLTIGEGDAVGEGDAAGAGHAAAPSAVDVQ